MSERSTLADKLARLTRDETIVNGALVLGPADASDSLSRVLGAIDDTMLPRDVTVSVDGASLTLHVSARRIRAIVAASDDLAVAPALLGAPVSQQDAATIDTLRRAFTTLLSRHGTVHLERTPLDAPDADVAAGIRVDALAPDDALLVSDSGGDIEQFARAVQQVAKAQIMLTDGNVDSATGDAVAIDSLQATLAGDWAQFESAHDVFLNDSTAPNLRIVVTHALTDCAICVAQAGMEKCIALVSAQSIGDVARIWAAVIAATTPQSA